MHVTATCDGRAVHRQFHAALPTESCFGGPIHAYVVRGAVTRSDDNYEARPVPLRRGDLVADEALIDVPRGGYALLGATECNNFHVVLGPGRYTSGTYDAGGRGDAFSGSRALVVGDRHAGGLAIPGKALVQPVGRGCANCSPPPISFEVRAQSARRVTIRVFRGAVRVVGGERLTDVERALAGQQVDILCARRCLLTGPRLWQPYEAWMTPPRYRATSLAHVLHGPRPANAALAPARAHVDVYRLRAAGAAPEQLAVLWQRQTRTGAGRAAGYLNQEQGLVVWQRSGPALWRRALTRQFASSDSPPNVTTGDVTGDGHPDILVRIEQGSGACGPREIFATVHARIRRIFYRDECESLVQLKDGAVRLTEPVGRCPYKQGSAHCFGGDAQIVERWNGRRLVVASRRVRCNLPRLDPTTECNRRKLRR
jgi:hypothetical protein